MGASLFRVCPGYAGAGFGDQRYAKVYYVLHDVADHGGEALDFVDGALKVQFVVYLQDHVGGKAFLFQAAAYAGHGDLDDVGGGSLHGVVHGGALAEAARVAVGGAQLGDMALSPEHGLSIAVGAGLLDRFIDVGLLGSIVHRIVGTEGQLILAVSINADRISTIIEQLRLAAAERQTVNAAVGEVVEHVLGDHELIDPAGNALDLAALFDAKRVRRRAAG